MVHLLISISTITGVAPEISTALIVAAKVRSGTITSSPDLIPMVFNAISKAIVPFDTAIPKGTFNNFANLFSNL